MLLPVLRWPQVKEVILQASKENQAGKAIDLVVSSVEIISDLKSQIAIAVEEQSSVTVEISKNTLAINEVADQTASGGYKVAESHEKLVALIAAKFFNPLTLDVNDLMPERLETYNKLMGGLMEPEGYLKYL